MKPKRKKIIDIILGVLLIASALILSRVFDLIVDEESYWLISSVVIPTFLAILGGHYIIKSLKYYIRCFQMKHYREIKNNK